MSAKYIIVYRPYHDNEIYSKDVYLDLSDAIQVVKEQTHDYYSYEGVAILEIDDYVGVAAYFEVTKDNSLIIHNPDEFSEYMIKDSE